jgi:hypothetical protein
MWKEAAFLQLNVQLWNLPGGTEENHEKSESQSTVAPRPTGLV